MFLLSYLSVVPHPLVIVVVLSVLSMLVYLDAVVTHENNQHVKIWDTQREKREENQQIITNMDDEVKDENNKNMCVIISYLSKFHSACGNIFGLQQKRWKWWYRFSRHEHVLIDMIHVDISLLICIMLCQYI
jgi:hypothetical protein